MWTQTALTACTWPGCHRPNPHSSPLSPAFPEPFCKRRPCSAIPESQSLTSWSTGNRDRFQNGKLRVPCGFLHSTIWLLFRIFDCVSQTDEFIQQKSRCTLTSQAWPRGGKSKHSLVCDFSLVWTKQRPKPWSSPREADRRVLRACHFGISFSFTICLFSCSPVLSTSFLSSLLLSFFSTYFYLTYILSSWKKILIKI